MFSEYFKQTDTSGQSDCLRDEMFSAATIEAIRGGGGGKGVCCRLLCPLRRIPIVLGTFTSNNS